MNIDSFKLFIAEHNLFIAGDKLLIGVSGGVDSVVLCELCHQAGYEFEIAHCNFQLRGEESDRDETFVKTLGERYRVNVWINHFDTAAYASEQKFSIQEAARELRYEWFLSMVNDDSNQLSHLLTAHHQDDSIETSMMNFFKGTGIAGLRGILPKQGKIIRPLLFASKQEILGFAAEHGLKWVDDSSNESDKYTRNYFRHQVIPFVQKIFPGVEKNLAQNLYRFRDTELLYQQAIAAHKKKLVFVKGSEVHIPVLKLQHSVPSTTILYEIIRDYGFRALQTPEVEALLWSESGRYVQSATHRIIRNRAWLIIAASGTEKASLIPIEQTGTFQFAAGNIDLHYQPAKKDAYAQNSTSIACVDAALIRFPLILRPWKAGDYFYPLGMQKKKKLARFFIDQKLSLTEKENTWVVEMDKKIVWVVGRRIDDRFKVRETTKEVLRMSFNAAVGR